MMARPYCVVVALLLLAEVTRFGEGTPNPEIVGKITRKGLKYARQYGIATLKKELSAIKLPDFSGSFRICLIGNVNYVFSGLRIRRFVLLNSNLRLHTEQGIRASLFNNYVSVSGNWKVQKSFVNLYGTFDLSVDDISISVSLNFGKDQSGQPTASLTHCSNSIGQVSIEISGYLRSVKWSGSQQPLTWSPISGLCQGEFFGQNGSFSVPFDAPLIRLPEKHDYMIYFAVSEYVFNMASRVYHQAGLMNFTIQNKHSFETSPESAPFLMFTPGNVTFMPVMDIQAFALMPNSSDCKALFHLRAVVLMESILNDYALHIIYPTLNAKLEEGSPLPLPKDIYLNSLELQVHKMPDQGPLVSQQGSLTLSLGRFGCKALLRFPQAMQTWEGSCFAHCSGAGQRDNVVSSVKKKLPSQARDPQHYHLLIETRRSEAAPAGGAGPGGHFVEDTSPEKSTPGGRSGPGLRADLRPALAIYWGLSFRL
ncbi:lipopolysaccharide-binding protein-like protein [Camelus ferus]|nr:lipopolysaccharide-binding protein-like protein [Camelus ferus]